MTIPLKKSGDISLALDLRYRAEYVLLRVLVALVRLLPLDLASAASARLWRLIAPRGRRHKRALENLELAFPEKSDAEREQIARAMWGNLGRVMAETMQIDRLLREPDRIKVRDSHVLERYRGKIGPAVAVTLHMGNWELVGWPLVRLGAKPAAIYRLVKNPYVDRYLRLQRRQLVPGGLLAKGKAHGSNAEGQRTARKVMDFVRSDGRLGIVSDLYDKNGLAVAFFGHPAKSTPLPAMIARRLGARLFAARCIRIGETSRFEIESVELQVRRTSNPGDDIRWLTAQIHQQFEAWVREHPEQWMWSNRRWS